MLELTCLHTGSSGNAFVLSSSAGRILLDAGISLKRIQQGIGYGLSSVDGALIGHSHSDHCLAVKDLVKNGVDCFMSAGCADALNVSGYRIKRIPTLKKFTVGDFDCVSFSTNHDAPDPRGFLCRGRADNQSCLYITDTYYVNYRFAAVDIIAIECNYITEHIDRQNTHPELLKQLYRSHLSLDSCLKFLAAQDLSKCRKVYLVHLSAERGDAEVMKRAVQRATGKETIIAEGIV